MLYPRSVEIYCEKEVGKKLGLYAFKIYWNTLYWALFRITKLGIQEAFTSEILVWIVNTDIVLHSNLKKSERNEYAVFMSQSFSCP